MSEYQMEQKNAANAITWVTLAASIYLIRQEKNAYIFKRKVISDCKRLLDNDIVRVLDKINLMVFSRTSTSMSWTIIFLLSLQKQKNAGFAEEYDTSTRGRRHRFPARAVGEGIYRIVKHKSGRSEHTHLMYKLEFPPDDKDNEPQESLNIEREGSFLIQIKSPDQHGGSQFSGIQSKRKAMFPAHLQGRFGNRRYCSADPPDFLNYEGCEFLLISASDDVEKEFGLELKTECKSDPSCSDLVKMFGETVVTAPLFEGTWS